MDVGTLELLRRGECRLVRGEPARFVREGLQLGDGTLVPCDAVVFATGFEKAAAHERWLAPELCDAIGPPAEAILNGQLGSRTREHVSGDASAVSGLRFLWGNLRMIRDSAPEMAESIARELS